MGTTLLGRYARFDRYTFVKAREILFDLKGAISDNDHQIQVHSSVKGEREI